MAKQYITATFQSGGFAYIYYSDDPIQVGDIVEATTPRGAVRRLDVVGVGHDKPPYETKPCFKVST